MENWDDIKYFLQVAKSGNVTSASTVLGVNHSTVSRRIKALEKQYGTRLFERVPSGYELTDAGSAIIEMAEMMENTSQQISRQLFSRDSRLKGVINLTMPHDLLDHCLMSEVSEFQLTYPEITLNLEVARGVKNLAAREADVAVRLSPAPPDYLIGTEITKLQHGIYVHHSFVNQGKIKLIVWQNEQEKPEWAQKHFPNSEIVLRVDDCHSMLTAVKMGIGIARLPCFLPDTIADPCVRRLELELPPSSWGVWVLSHIDLRNTLRVKRCRDFLRDALVEKQAYFQGKKSIYLF